MVERRAHRLRATPTSPKRTGTTDGDAKTRAPTQILIQSLTVATTSIIAVATARRSTTAKMAQAQTLTRHPQPKKSLSGGTAGTDETIKRLPRNRQIVPFALRTKVTEVM